MKKSRHSEEKIIAAVKQLERGRKTAEVARELDDLLSYTICLPGSENKRSRMRHLSLLLLVCFGVAQGASLANWHADYSPCNRHAELLKQGHMNLGVRVATANQVLAEQFRRALDSWARVLDLDWHEDNTQSCSIQLIDGGRELFEPSAIAARSQLPDRLDFQGWIAFNPAQELSGIELYRISLHELGHLLGLPHSSNVMSVMYGFDLDGEKWLDATDLAALATHHKLRTAILDRPVKLTGPPPAGSPDQ